MTDILRSNHVRYVFAITALVLAGILLILGIGQTTFMAGPRVITHSASLQAENGLAVLSDETLTAVAGQANVVVNGVDPVIAVGHDRDVHAWVAPFGYATVESDASTAQLVLSPVAQDFEAAESFAA
ncbi:MAG: hypothetical protein GX862_02685, partial [Leucobacter sp.]|nr:hypothetical protein [Leucobacter sp.]